MQTSLGFVVYKCFAPCLAFSFMAQSSFAHNRELRGARDLTWLEPSSELAVSETQHVVDVDEAVAAAHHEYAPGSVLEFVQDRSYLSSNVYARMAAQVVTFPELGIRGHSSSVRHGIGADVPYDGYYEEMVTFPERNPRMTNIMMATVKTWLADLIVQALSMRNAKSTTFDVSRSLVFAVFGFLYNGLVQWFFYVTILTALCPRAIEFANEPFHMKMHDRTGAMDLAKQVCLDNFVIAVFVYWPTFYVTRELLNGGFRRGLWFSIRTGIPKYIQNMKTDNLVNWSLWLPSDVFIFSCPMFMRLPMGHTVSFVWTMALSYMRGGEAH